MANVDELVEEVALAIQTAWVAQADKYQAENNMFAGREDDIAHMASSVATEFYKPFAKAAIKAVLEGVMAMPPDSNDMSDDIYALLKQLED